MVALPGPDDPTALAAPLAMQMNWNTMLGSTSKGTSGGVYTAVCPSDYVAMGSVAIEHDILKSNITPADFPSLRCVKSKYTVTAPAPVGQKLSLVWNSKP
eukprot:SAG31_NODE_15701_length_742_cov_1.157076_1_plen_99_part_10